MESYQLDQSILFQGLMSDNFYSYFKGKSVSQEGSDLGVGCLHMSHKKTARLKWIKTPLSLILHEILQFLFFVWFDVLHPSQQPWSFETVSSPNHIFS